MTWKQRFERRREIARKAWMGIPHEDIAEEYNLSRTSVKKAAWQFGYSAGIEFDKGDVRTVLPKLEEGIPPTEIAEDSDVSLATIAQIATAARTFGKTFPDPLDQPNPHT